MALEFPADGLLVLHDGNQVRDERLYCGPTNISKNGEQNRICRECQQQFIDCSLPAG